MQLFGCFNAVLPGKQFKKHLFTGRTLLLYGTGFLFAGMNIVGSAALSAVESVKAAFAASILRGFAAISVFAFLLSAFFGLNGVWAAFPAAELVTLFVTAFGLHQLQSPAVPLKDHRSQCH